MGKVGYYTIDLRHTAVSLFAFMQVSGLSDSIMHVCIYVSLVFV